MELRRLRIAAWALLVAVALHRPLLDGALGSFGGASVRIRPFIALTSAAIAALHLVVLALLIRATRGLPRILTAVAAFGTLALAALPYVDSGPWPVGDASLTALTTLVLAPPIARDLSIASAAWAHQARLASGLYGVSALIGGVALAQTPIAVCAQLHGWGTSWWVVALAAVGAAALHLVPAGGVRPAGEG